MWECEFDEEGIVQQKPELLTHPVVHNTPLTTRDALYGGRTEAMCLHYKARDDETIEYCDIMSLYPYVCKYGKFPTKHPRVLVGDMCKNVEACLKMEGLMKCTIVPPKNLYHPVLPFRCNKKLLFCLCRTCVLEQNTKDECRHYTDAERALTGTWVIDDVRLAVEKGYKVLDIHEVYQYRVTQYDRATGEWGLFADYINTFLKLKAEASGYPSWVRTSDDEDRYIELFWESEGILLNKDAIKQNPAKRGLAKLCLNSMWGKLTERNNRPQTKLISEPRELYKFLSTPGIEVMNLIFANDQVVWISWRIAEDMEHVPSLRHTNDVCSFVTAFGRMHLYSYLDRLQDRALSCDTDSVIYIQPRNEPALVETEDNLGAMTSELKPHEYIQEYVAAGPKNYSYKSLNSMNGECKTICKVRGITLNYNASQLVNFDRMKDMILRRDETETVIVHTEKKMKRKKGKGRININTEPEDKIYRVSFLKRRRLNDNTSVPFGYI
jgi:hypothetical protein